MFLFTSMLETINDHITLWTHTYQHTNMKVKRYSLVYEIQKGHK